MGALLVIAFIGMGVLHFFISAFVLWTLWGWFMVPLGLPSIGLPWVIGISCVASMFIPMPAPTPDDKRTGHLISILLKPMFAIGIGYVAKAYL